MTLTLRDVAALVEGSLSGDGEIGIHGVAGVENAESGDGKELTTYETTGWLSKYCTLISFAAFLLSIPSKQLALRSRRSASGWAPCRRCRRSAATSRR